MELETALKYWNLETIHFMRQKIEKFLARMDARSIPIDPWINDQITEAHEIVATIDQHIEKNYSGM